MMYSEKLTQEEVIFNNLKAEEAFKIAVKLEGKRCSFWKINRLISWMKGIDDG